MENAFVLSTDFPVRTRICALPECTVEFRVDGYSRMQEYCCDKHRVLARARRRKERAQKRKAA